MLLICVAPPSAQRLQRQSCRSRATRSRILAETVMLAADGKISDPGILAQLRT